jgi:hypothetical protein
MSSRLRQLLTVLLLCLTAYGACWGQSAGGKAPGDATVAPKPLVAVLELAAGAPFSADEASVVTQRFEIELQQTNAYTLLERREMDRILEEQGFQQSGACGTSDCQVEVGKLLGVEKLIVGSIGKAGSVLSFTLKLVDVSSGEILASHAADYPDIETLLKVGCATAAGQFSGKGKGTGQRGSPAWLWPGVGVGVAAAGVATYLLLSGDETGKTVRTSETVPLE